MANQFGIAIVACSGPAPVDSMVQLGVENLERQGYVVHNYYDPSRKFQRFGATDEERLQQLQKAIDNPEVHIVMALRGGYGLSRLLPRLNFDHMAHSGKLFVGHSDFTALQLGLLAKTGAPSLAGPMLCDDFTRPDPSALTLNSFSSSLSTGRHVLNFGASDNPDLQVQGKLWGGNLAMLVHLLGTPYFPEVDGGILFIEDVAEHPFRVERMLLQLHYAGVLQKQKAIVFGDFTAYKLGPMDNGYDFAEMLAYLRATVGIPMLTGLPFGHVTDKVSLMVGAEAQLNCSGGQVELSMPGWRTPK